MNKTEEKKVIDVTNDSTSELQKSILKIQTDDKAFAVKDAHMEKLVLNPTNGLTEDKGYDYFTEIGLLNVLKPLLKREGIIYKIEQIGEPTFIFNHSIVHFYSKGRLTLIKGDEKVEYGIILSASNSDAAKVVGSALTYAVRYWLSKIFGIPTPELDPDTTENTLTVEKAMKKSSPQPQNQVTVQTKPTQSETKTINKLKPLEVESEFERVMTLIAKDQATKQAVLKIIAPEKTGLAIKQKIEELGKEAFKEIV